MQNNILETTENIELLARFDFLDLCLLGETGTGKTHTARRIHELSPRAKMPFVSVSCAELTPSIIEAELFGYEKGAFTGAVSSKAGKFEAAAGGTLFLDEIGELPSNLQAKLLKVVEEKCITRVGGTRPHKLDVRIIYATHRDLSILREDLRYRIAAHAINLKPLRERREEIVPLAQLFLLEFSKRCGQTIKASDETLKLLEISEWRGNVRELGSFVEKWCLDALFAAEREQRSYGIIELDGEFLSAKQQTVKIFSLADKFPQFLPGEKMEDYLGKIEMFLLKQAMDANNNNQTHAARELGISRGGLIKKLKRISH
jgi:transcriptional regulator with GAF, ATPase, and Fis domain